MRRADVGPTLNPGLLRHEIAWMNLTKTGLNEFGEEERTPEEFIRCRAQVQALAGRELDAARQVWAEAKYEIMQHWYSGLRTDMQIYWLVDGEIKTLDVLDIQDRTGMGRIQHVIAKERIG